jgi:hypothetical protein
MKKLLAIFNFFLIKATLTNSFEMKNLLISFAFFIAIYSKTCFGEFDYSSYKKLYSINEENIKLCRSALKHKAKDKTIYAITGGKYRAKLRYLGKMSKIDESKKMSLKAFDKLTNQNSAELFSHEVELDVEGEPLKFLLQKQLVNFWKEEVKRNSYVEIFFFVPTVEPLDETDCCISMAINEFKAL